MIQLGIIGLSEGNGHPYSFSAIINGYHDEYMKQSGWDVIYSYLKKRDTSEFGYDGVKVTHVWTQDRAESLKIAQSTYIENICDDYTDMLGSVDGLILARDDYENHYAMAKPFLDAGMTVFIDKPLTLDLNELSYYLPFLKNGKLMSTSGLRYCCELDDLRANIDSFRDMKLITATVINSWEKYGIHLLDAVFGAIGSDPVSVRQIDPSVDSFVIKMSDDSLFIISALSNIPKTFHVDFWSGSHRYQVEINDNFTAFRRTLARFVYLLKGEGDVLDPNETLKSIKTLIAGRIARQEGREVSLNEFDSISQNT